jgi:hypothetical protein
MIFLMYGWEADVQILDVQICRFFLPDIFWVEPGFVGLNE